MSPDAAPDRYTDKATASSGMPVNTNHSSIRAVPFHGVSKDETGAVVPVAPLQSDPAEPVSLPEKAAKAVCSPGVLAGSGTVIYTIDQGWWSLVYAAFTAVNFINSFRAQAPKPADASAAIDHKKTQEGKALKFIRSLINSEGFFPFAQSLVNAGLALTNLVQGDPLRASVFMLMAWGSLGVALSCHNSNRNIAHDCNVNHGSDESKSDATSTDRLSKRMLKVIVTPGVAYGIANCLNTAVYTDLTAITSNRWASASFFAGLFAMAVGTLVGLKPLFSGSTQSNTTSTKVSGVGQMLAGISSLFQLGAGRVAIANLLWGVSVYLSARAEDRKNADARL